MTLLERSILETILYFDIFDYPLRANEIHRWLWRNGADFEEVISTLQTSEFLREKLSSKGGFFFLTPPNSPPISPQAKQGGQGGVVPSIILRGGEKGLIETRLKRYRFAEKKFKKAEKVARFLSRLPNVSGIAVCNDLGYGNSPEEGDIDLFIVTKKNRVWTVRFLVTLFLKLFRLRPGEAKEDAICPSFFVDENHLNLRDLAAVNPPEDDVHFVYWINQMTPVFGDKIWRDFYEANRWTSAVLPNRQLFLTNPVRNIISNGASPVRKVKIAVVRFRKPRWVYEIEQRFPPSLGNLFESSLKLKFLSPRIKETMNKNNDVVIRDGTLKLHTNDRRREYCDKFYNKRISLMGSLGSPHELH